MEGLLFFAGSFFIEGFLALIIMMIVTEPARAWPGTPRDTTGAEAPRRPKAA